MAMDAATYQGFLSGRGLVRTSAQLAELLNYAAGFDDLYGRRVGRHAAFEQARKVIAAHEGKAPLCCAMDAELLGGPACGQLLNVPARTSAVFCTAALSGAVYRYAWGGVHLPSCRAVYIILDRPGAPRPGRIRIATGRGPWTATVVPFTLETESHADSARE